MIGCLYSLSAAPPPYLVFNPSLIFDHAIVFFCQHLLFISFKLVKHFYIASLNKCNF